jgi:hypothetical protein
MQHGHAVWTCRKTCGMETKIFINKVNFPTHEKAGGGE